MLDRLGKPLRAVCNIKVREARIRDTDGHVDANDREQLSAMRKRMAAREAQP
jgi:hypothetical protein